MTSRQIMYGSTNLKAPSVTFEEALLKGMAPDGGLYMPEAIPVMDPDEIAALTGKKYHEIAYTVGRKLLDGDLPAPDLKAIVKDAYDYEVPLEKVFGRKYVMRLDQGPTASFKDFAARMMGRLMQYFLARRGGRLLILTATSGDTGSAIANAFYGLDNIKVVVLFPREEVTDRQRKQMTTLGRNVRIIGIDGKFDDCQAMVKQAFNDRGLDGLNLSSANSINIGRLLPQSMYYFYAFAELGTGKTDEQVVFSVPSGNFGDLCGGLIAHRMGLPVKRFVVATNENDEFPEFVETGTYEKIEPSRNCISSAMNVGHPSNVPRLVSLYGGTMDEKGKIGKQPDMDAIRRDMFAVSVDDWQTERTIHDAWMSYGLLLEPHGSVGWAGLQRYLASNEEGPDQLCVSLETAHPAKFPEKIREILSFDPDPPPSLKHIEKREEKYDSLEKSYADFRKFLEKNYG
jgi:threonine synthase